MLSALDHWIANPDATQGAFFLLVWATGVATAVIIVAVLTYRAFAMRESLGALLRMAVLVVISGLGWMWFAQSAVREQAAERRSLEERANTLTAQALAPGSALGCLNGVENETLQTACEHALLQSPQSVAAAVAYVDARLKLLADGAAVAARDRAFAASLEQSRKALEADRFGLVAHVLAGRGCTAEDCAAFTVLADTRRIKANLQERAFENRLAARAAEWPGGTNATAAATSSAPGLSPALVPQALGAAPGNGPSKFSFPSSASIPPVSIMAAEPTGAVGGPDAAERPPARRPQANKPANANAKQLPAPPRAQPGPVQLQGPLPNPQ